METILIDSLVAEHLCSCVCANKVHKTKLQWTVCVSGANGLTKPLM